MSLKVASTLFVAASVGFNVYQFMTNRGLKAILNSNGISTDDKCEILRKAVASLEDDLSSLKSDLNELIDGITSGKVPTGDIAERVMDIYRKASKEAPVADAVDAAVDAVKDAADAVVDTVKETGSK